MAFSKYVITNAGRDLLLACMATGDFQISSLVLGSGSYSGIMSEITAVVTPELTFSGDSLSVVKRDNQLEVRCKLTNEQLESGFEWREYGVYATDGENTVLYCYDNAGSDSVPISAASGGTAISNTIKVILTISNDAVANITFEPDPDMPIPDPTPSDAGKAIIVGADGSYTLGEAGSKDAVLYTAQSLTTEQKAQARTNIGVSEAAVLYTEQTLTEAQKTQARANIDAAESSHTQAASTISAGTFAGDVKAPATTDMATPILRNSVVTNTDPGAGASSSYPEGTEICVYE